MKIGAVIAEFNPFHTGHGYLVSQIRKECDGAIAIMSGNFVQRGECAIYDKEERTRAALLGGVDLVLELPCVYALSSAEGFAMGSVATLNATGVVSELYFGSECGDIDALTRVAHLLNNETKEFKEALDENLRLGLSYPAARLSALKKISPDADILSTPNNILATEYIRQIEKSNSEIVPKTIARIGSGYNDTEIKEEIASASAVRKLIKKGEAVTSYSEYTYEKAPVFPHDFDTLIASRVKSASKEELLSVPDCNEEIASRILGASKYNTLEEILDAVSCKSYTQSRIRRILFNLVIGNRFSFLPSPSYIRPLGFNKRGSEILGKMKNTALLPVIARGALLKDDSVFALECRATDIYNLVRNIEGGEEFRLIPFQG